MILSGNQPCYLPWIGLFNRMSLSDVYMHCGHLQYQAGSFHSHNFIRTGELIIGVKRPHIGPINEMIIDGGHYRKKHIRAIYLAYHKFPHFEQYFPALKGILGLNIRMLDELNRLLIDTICVWLGIKSKIVDSAFFEFSGDATDKIIQMCKAVGADTYLSSENAAGYIGYQQIEKMKEAGITHIWQKFVHPVYGQEKEINGGILSIIDLLFRRGPEAGQIVRGAGHVVA